MSIFAEKENLFNIYVHFKYVYDEDGNESGIRIIRPENIDEDTVTIEAKATGRDYQTLSFIKEDSALINHITGKPILRTYTLYSSIIIKFFKSWNIYDEETSQPFPINLENVNKMHYLLVTSLAKQWLKKTSGKVNYKE